MSVSALSPPLPRRVLAIAPGLAFLVLAGVEIICGWDVLRARGLLSARHSVLAVLIFGGAAAGVGIVAVTVSSRLRWVAVLAPAAAAAVVLLATATLGGQASAMVTAVLTMSAVWYAGRGLLRLLGADPLAGRAAVAWLAGLAPLCLLTLLLGRLSLLKWWTMGVVVVVLGLLGAISAGNAIWERRAVIGRELTGSDLGAACAGMILLTIGAAAIYTAAPEIQFDALYAKAYLPTLWAHSGTIGPLNNHVQLNITGWAQLIASWGHLLGAPAVGRYLQLFAFAAGPALIWSWGRRFGSLGPLAAVAIAVTPALFTQATTAYDDLLLGIAGFAFAIAVYEALQPRFAVSNRAAGIALGLMAGAAFSLKTHLIPICVLLVLAWIVASRRPRAIVERFIFGALGTLVTAGPPLVLRWIDTGNPVFPAYNNIFRSPYWPPINEKFDFPFWRHPGALGPLKAVWDAIFRPTVMAQVAPPGSYAVLWCALLVAVLVVWRYRRSSPGAFALWISIALATVVWWIEFRYLRYVIPLSFASVALLLVVFRGGSLNAGGARLGVAGVSLAVVACFALSVAQLWNVPGRNPPVSAAIGRWKASDYLQVALPERAAILAFDRIAPPHASMITDAFERTWLTGGKDLYVPFELQNLLALHGPVPTTGDAVLARLRAMGIDWALVNRRGPLLGSRAWLRAVLLTHGQIRFSAAGWDLYQLVDRPGVGAPVAPCDRVVTGIPRCWRGHRNALGEATTAIYRVIRVCPGRIVAVNALQVPSRPETTFFIHFIGAGRRSQFVPGKTLPGALLPTYATVPSGSYLATIVVPRHRGSVLTGASVSLLGGPCG